MNIKSLFKWSSGTLALVPGFAIILSNLGVPPGISATLYGGVIEATGSITFLIMLINKEKISSWKLAKINRIAIVSFCLFVLACIAYLALYNLQVVYSEKYDIHILFPLWSGKELTFMIGQAGSRSQSIDAYGPAGVQQAINRSPGALETTRIMFSLLYILLFETLVVAFGVLGFKGGTVE
jgi:hypothetical protein